MCRLSRASSASYNLHDWAGLLRMQTASCLILLFLCGSPNGGILSKLRFTPNYLANVFDILYSLLSMGTV
jgi:hypothetical protein